tara:strand:- start:231 stop:1727 length:1497 start_codon:yes stop_codon:yes gene_type:complete
MDMLEIAHSRLDSLSPYERRAVLEERRILALSVAFCAAAQDQVDCADYKEYDEDDVNGVVNVDFMYFCEDFASQMDNDLNGTTPFEFETEINAQCGSSRINIRLGNSTLAPYRPSDACRLGEKIPDYLLPVKTAGAALDILQRNLIFNMTVVAETLSRLHPKVAPIWTRARDYVDAAHAMQVDQENHASPNYVNPSSDTRIFMSQYGNFPDRTFPGLDIKECPIAFRVPWYDWSAPICTRVSRGSACVILLEPCQIIQWWAPHLKRDGDFYKRVFGNLATVTDSRELNTEFALNSADPNCTKFTCSAEILSNAIVECIPFLESLKQISPTMATTFRDKAPNFLPSSTAGRALLYYNMQDIAHRYVRYFGFGSEYYSERIDRDDYGISRLAHALYPLAFAPREDVEDIDKLKHHMTEMEYAMGSNAWAHPCMEGEIGHDALLLSNVLSTGVLDATNVPRVYRNDSTGKTFSVPNGPYAVEETPQFVYLMQELGSAKAYY